MVKAITHGKPSSAWLLRQDFLVEVGWLRGERTKYAGKNRSSLIIILATEHYRDKVVHEGLTMQGLLCSTHLWSFSL